MRPSASVSPEPTSSSPRQSSTRTPAAGSAALGVEDVGRDGHLRESRSLDAVFARDLLLVGVDERPSRTTSLPPTSSRSTRCGPERTRPPTGSSAPPSSRPSVRQIARSARLPGSSEPMSSRPSTAAPPRVAEAKRLARGHRAAAAAAAGDEERLLHLEEEVAALVRRGAVDAEADPHARVEQLAHGRDAGAEAEVRGRAVRDARRRARANRSISGCERWTQCAHQTSPSSQPTRSRYSTGVQP